jgi:alkylation response protein AidB-like acyl-CoA dehydrogenase
MVTFLTDERRALQDATRAFVEREVAPYLQDWEDAGEVPRSLHLAAAKAGLLGLGFPEEAGGQGGDLLDSTAMQEAFFEAGTRTSTYDSSAVSEQCQPIFRRLRSTVKPGVPLSTTISDRPACPDSPVRTAVVT